MKRPGGKTLGNFAGRLAGEVEPGRAGLPRRFPDDAAIDETDAFGLHRFTKRNRPFGRDRVGVDVHPTKPGIENASGDLLRRMRRADTQQDRASVSQLAKRAGILKATAGRALQR